MIIGLGTDIVDCKRIQTLIEKHGDHFLNRIFTPQEIKHCQAKPNPAQAFGKTFAAKEAMIKALAFTEGLKWHDMEIIRLPHGEPTIKITGTAHQLALNRTQGKAYRLHLSLSDEPPYALAFVILETEG
jgi:holo-[acyl-carrier protein] synthase